MFRVRSYGSRMAMLAALVVATGCATTTSRGTQRRSGAMDAARSVRVVVENQNWLDMNVYVQTQSGARFRVGTVVTGQTQVFTLRSNTLGASDAIRLIGDPVGSAALSQTPLLNVRPGVTAYWRIGNAESTSFSHVR